MRLTLPIALLVLLSCGAVPSAAQTTLFTFDIESLGLGPHTELRGPFPIEADGVRETREWFIAMEYGMRWVVVAERPNGQVCIGAPFDYRVDAIDGEPRIGWVEWPVYSDAMGATIYLHRYGSRTTVKRFTMPSC